MRLTVTNSPLLWVALGCVLTLGASCSDCGSRTSDQRVEDAEESSGDEAESAETLSEEKPRMAFGVPLPPEYDTVSFYKTYAKVSTKLSLKEVRSFYESRIVDFEAVQEGEHRLMFYGLHEHQPDIEVRQPAPRYNSEVRIRVKRVADPEPVSAAGFERKEDRRVAQPEKGTPDETTLPNGEKFAPGARWGEPYTPPAGSPLADPRFKSNWGKPYGEWVHQ